MGLFEGLHRAVDALRDAPGLWHLRRAGADRRFAANRRSNLFRGVFETAEAALASAPASRPLSYDNQESAELYLQRLQVDDYDYPSMFWLQRSFDEGLRTLADVGGSIGIKYFAFAEFMPFPAGLRWQVIDMPAVAERGRAFAASRGSPAGLEFSSELGDIDGVDVVLASGALQYLPRTLAQMLADCRRKPRRIVVNTTPIHDTHSYFTLNSIGTAFCAYRVQARADFIAGVTAQGYVLRHQWRNIGKPLRLPFDPAYGLSDYSGFCFDALP